MVNINIDKPKLQCYRTIMLKTHRFCPRGMGVDIQTDGRTDGQVAASLNVSYTVDGGGLTNPFMSHAVANNFNVITLEIPNTRNLLH